MQILIIDDSALWIKQGKSLLEQAGHLVMGVVVSNPKQFTSESLPEPVADILITARIDVVLIDKDLGGGITSTRAICVMRHNFPKLPIIRWTGGRWHDIAPHMRHLGITEIDKPSKKEEAEFVETFNKAVDEQKLIISGPMGIFASLTEVASPERDHSETKTKQLRQLSQIAELATKDRVDSGSWQYPWMITGSAGGVTMHELGHCICDGVLTAEDIRPHLSALQTVIGKFEAAGEIDERFSYCAKFITVGNLDELELVRHCY